MARKLKSDKVLFLATLLLVLASVVMVYSASAAMAEFTIRQLAPVPGEAGHVGRARDRPDGGGHARGLPRLAAAGHDLGRARLCGRGAGGGAVQRADQRDPPLVRHRRVRHPAVGDRQAGRHLFHGGAARAAHAPGQRPARDPGAAGRRHRRDDGPDPARAGLRHLGMPGGHRRPDAVFGGPEPALRRGDRSHRRAGGDGPHRHLALQAQAHPLVPLARGRTRRARGSSCCSR